MVGRDRCAFLAVHGAKIKAIATRGELGPNAELMAALPHLEIISCYGVGTDAIDLGAARARGIKVSNTPDVLTEDVADLALGLTLTVTQQIPKAELHVRSGNWRTGNMPLVTCMCGKRLGIIGMEHIGAAVAKRAAAFDMTISYFNRNKRRDVHYMHMNSITELAKASDFLVATVAGGAATGGQIGRDVFAALGPQGFFTNVAPGSVVDEAALIDALTHNTMAGAGFDVFLNEPNIDGRFLTLENVVLQPHHGSSTVETRKAMGQLLRANLNAYFAGQALLTEVR